MNKDSEDNKELRVLRMVKRVLTDVAKDTYTQPGVKHPLSDSTIMGLRDCLALITSRESELQSGKGGSPFKPRFVDEPKNSVVVSIKPKPKPTKPKPPPKD